MYKVFKIKGEHDDREADYIIVGHYIKDDDEGSELFESVSVFSNDEKELFIDYAIDICPNDGFYELESVYDRVTDAMVHIKFELTLRDKLDQEDNQ